MQVAINRVGFFHAATGIWLCRAEILKLLDGEAIGLGLRGHDGFSQDITVHMDEIGRVSGIHVDMELEVE